MFFERALACIVLLCAAALACTADNKLEPSRDFDDFDTWWLGEEFEQLEVAHAEDTLFLYGTCQPGPDSGCPPPVQVILEQLCELPHLDFGPAGREEPLRGSATFQRIRDGQALVRTGTVAITLFARDDATLRRMAEALESLNIEPPVAPGEPMASPSRCDNR